MRNYFSDYAQSIFPHAESHVCEARSHRRCRNWSMDFFKEGLETLLLAITLYTDDVSSVKKSSIHFFPFASTDRTGLCSNIYRYHITPSFGYSKKTTAYIIAHFIAMQSHRLISCVQRVDNGRFFMVVTSPAI